MTVVRTVFSAVVVVAVFVAGGFGLSVLTAGSLAAATGPGVTFDALITLVGAVLAWVVFGCGHDLLVRPIRDRGDHSYTVVRGDCLWDIAKAHLHAGATDSQIDAEWYRWYAANRSTVGTNPDLILPGQVFTPPPS